MNWYLTNPCHTSYVYQLHLSTPAPCQSASKRCSLLDYTNRPFTRHGRLDGCPWRFQRGPGVTPEQVRRIQSVLLFVRGASVAYSKSYHRTRSPLCLFGYCGRRPFPVCVARSSPHPLHRANLTVTEKDPWFSAGLLLLFPTQRRIRSKIVFRER
jgi:hypothetical protein